MTTDTQSRPTAAMREELLPIITQGIIGHVTIYHAESAWWSYCAKEGRITMREEVRLRRLARHRLEQYIAGKLREQRKAEER